MKELWTPLVHPEIEKGYLISTFGNIKILNGNLIKPYKSTNGYNYMPLVTKVSGCFKNGNRIAIHYPIDELVALHFNDMSLFNTGKRLTVKHLDHNTYNDRADNLEWIEDIETWVAMYGFEDTHIISSWGRINNIKTGCSLTPRINDRGYASVSIKVHGKHYFKTLHRLLMMSFNKPIDTNLVINHINENKTDNRLKNLEFVTQRDNMRFGNCSRLSGDTQSLAVKCVETGKVYESMKIASDETGINYGNISSCCSGRLRIAGGFHWIIIDNCGSD